MSTKDNSRRSFPWFWLAKLFAGAAAALTWRAAYPHAALWQFFVAGFVAAIAMDALRYGYRAEQKQILARRSGREL